jgi:hypothetical protein
MISPYLFHRLALFALCRALLDVLATCGVKDDARFCLFMGQVMQRYKISFRPAPAALSTNIAPIFRLVISLAQSILLTSPILRFRLRSYISCHRDSAWADQ